MLSSASVTTNIYASEPGRLLLIAATSDALTALKAFVLSQPETDYIETGGDLFFPKGRKAPLTSPEDRKRLDSNLNEL